MGVNKKGRTPNSMLPRTGIYGGAFDPVHSGHLAVAQAALVEMSLDELFFVPTVEPPHKTGRTPYVHRLSMLKLALEAFGEERFSLSIIEEQLPTPSYSINTLQALQQVEEREYFFILGVDAFLTIECWKKWEELLSLVSLVVSPRKGYPEERLFHLLERLGYAAVDGFFRYGGHGQMRKDIFLLQTVPPEVSSSDITRSLHKSRAAAYGLDCLSPDVVSYILSHKLYGGKEDICTTD